MKKITNFLLAFMIGSLSLRAQTSCTDRSGYVDSKNTGNTGYYTLLNGSEEAAAQTYYYSGPGRLLGARIYGNYPGFFAGVPLKISVYNVDANNLPTTLILSVNTTWRQADNSNGYIDVVFPHSGITINSKFAISTEIRTGVSPFGNSFQLKYTGDGEGMGQNLASLKGTSTGFNWSSAKDEFSKDGDFYIEPMVRNFIASIFSVPSVCANTGTSVSFTNLSLLSKDSMFNKIALSSYSGSNYFYSWNFGDGSGLDHTVSPSHIYASAGVYTVTLTTTLEGWNATCSDVKTIQISVGLEATTSSVSNATCYGLADGSIQGGGVGGSAPYMFSLDGNGYQFGNSFTGLHAGNYTMYVKDNVGCKSNVAFTITQPSKININSVQTTNASCGANDGAFLVSATGGVSPLTYQINSGSFQSSGSFANLSSGLYTLLVKDANGCMKDTLIAINSASGPLLTLVSYNNVSCNGGTDGAIMVSSTGGTGTPAYSIDGITFQASGVFSNLAAGTYIVIVKDVAGCIDTRVVKISQSPALAVTASSSMTSCNGGNDGEIAITSHIGGIGSHSYSINGVNYQSGTVFVGLTAGSYTVYVRDIAGCTATTNVIVEQPAAIALNTITTDITCYGGETGAIDVSATGGTAPFSYSIDDDFQPTGEFSGLTAGTYVITVKDEHNCKVSTTVQLTEGAMITATVNSTNSTCGNSNGAVLVIGNGGSGSGYMYSINGISYQASGLFSSLVDSTYFISVKDGLGCTKIFTANVADSDGPVIMAATSTDVTCHNGSTGTITITSVTGGTGTLQYNIDGSPFQTSGAFTDLEAGTHVVTVKDANGCSGDTVIVLTEPNAFTILTSVSDVTCFGGNDGSVTITAAGGSGTLTYSLNNGTYQSSNMFSGLSAGEDMAVTVKDAGGCSRTVFFEVSAPSEIIISAGVFNVTCFGSDNGSIIINAYGGTGTLEYSLDGSVYQSGNVFTGLSGGSKTIYVKDANNCIKTYVTNIAEPSALNLTSAITDVSCHGGNDGSIDLTISGGTSAYSVSWSNEMETEDLSGLAAGSYTVIVTDENGCTKTQSFTITEPSAPLVVNGVITDATGSALSDGSVDITVTGGTTPYMYSWSTNATSEDISGIMAGIYTVTITDANACNTSANFTVNVSTGNAKVEASNDYLSVYPNPISDNINIKSTGFSIDHVRVYSVLGQVILDEDAKGSVIKINTADYNPGIYFLQISHGNKITTKRIDVVK